MRRRTIFGAIVGVGVLVAWARGARLHERLVAHCERMFERMPDTFPPKKMLRGIEQTRANTARILELLEADEVTGRTARAEAASRAGVRHAA